MIGVPIACSAVVDPCGPAFRVTVTEKPPSLMKRVYFLWAKDEEEAAWEGIRLFESEMKVRHMAPEGMEDAESFKSVRRLIVDRGMKVA